MLFGSTGGGTLKWLEIILVVMIIGTILPELYDLISTTGLLRGRCELSRYIKGFWNYFDCGSILCLVLSIFLRLNLIRKANELADPAEIEIAHQNLLNSTDFVGTDVSAVKLLSVNNGSRTVMKVQF